MPTATVVATFVENGCACLAIRVTEPIGEHVEYIGRVPLEELTGTAADKRAKLIAAAKAVRNAQLPAPPPALPSIPPTLTL